MKFKKIRRINHCSKCFVFLSLCSPGVALAQLDSTEHRHIIAHHAYESTEEKMPQVEQMPLSQDNQPPINEQALHGVHTNWIDRQHDNIMHRLSRTAYHIDDWFGEPDLSHPASASLRVMLDVRHDKYDGTVITPKIRGRLRLPVLQRRLSVILGDVDDDAILSDASIDNRQYDKGGNSFGRIRDYHGSLALRFSQLKKSLGVDTDIGLRAINDIYLRLKVARALKFGDRIEVKGEQIYRYGSRSEHFARTNFDIYYHEQPNTQLANQLYLEYKNRNHQEHATWGDSLYRQHRFMGQLGQHELNYGVYMGGVFKNAHTNINTYGPFINYRMPLWREWVYMQTELSYYNDKALNRRHYPRGLIRFEMLF